MESHTLNRQAKKVSIKYKQPNPLFEKWLLDWKEEAAAKGSDLQYCYAKALNTLKRYPLPLRSGKDCGILQFFGKKLCARLDAKLAEYRKTHPEIHEEVPLSRVLPYSLKTRLSRSISPKRKRKKSKRPALSGFQPEPATSDCISDKSKTRRSLSEKTSKTQNGVNKKTSKTKQSYVPAWRSGPYALLVTLLNKASDPGYTGYMSKNELQTAAQYLCDTSFKKADPGSHYTAWSSMSGLIKKGLVSKTGCPARFSLTEEGEMLAVKLAAIKDPSAVGAHLAGKGSQAQLTGSYDSTASKPDRSPTKSAPAPVTLNIDLSSSDSEVEVGQITLTPHQEQLIPVVDQPVPEPLKSKRKAKEAIISENTAAPLMQDEVTLIFPPDTFDVILLVDTQETGGLSRKKDEDATIQELSALRVTFEVRHLEVGDFLWICRDKKTAHELVLPYIVERKRMDDFGKSIKDGRFHEQKFRLKQCGVQNLIYLVESYGNNHHTGLPLSTIQQAAVNTQVVDGFTVMHTAGHRQSMSYLATMTSLLCSLYQKKTVVSCSKKNLPLCTVYDDLVSLMSFMEFNKSSGKTKNYTVREMFVKQLLQLHGLSVDKALAIVDRYATPQALLAAYKTGGGEKLLEKIPHGALNRLLGPVISRTLHQLYTSKTLQ